MSKHRVVDGRLLQMDKSYSQLKQKQKEKISEWMYQAFRKQTMETLSDEEALQLVFERIEEAKIWIPDYEIVNRYRSKKNQFRKRLAGENICIDGGMTKLMIYHDDHGWTYTPEK